MRQPARIGHTSRNNVPVGWVQLQRLKRQHESGHDPPPSTLLPIWELGKLRLHMCIRFTNWYQEEDLPVIQFSGTLAASAQLKCESFFQIWVSCTATYSAYPPWAVFQRSTHLYLSQLTPAISPKISSPTLNFEVSPASLTIPLNSTPKIWLAPGGTGYPPLRW